MIKRMPKMILDHFQFNYDMGFLNLPAFQNCWNKRFSKFGGENFSKKNNYCNEKFTTKF